MDAVRASLSQFLRHYLVALQYFTRLPVTGSIAQWTDFRPEMLRASAVHFPGVGLVVGFVACFAFAVVSLGLPTRPLNLLAAAFACTIATALLTGAFHEDGLADLADGLGGSADRERALEIMKDSRIGSFGAMALVLTLGLKLSLIGVIASESAGGVMAALLAAHVVSRYWPLFIIHTLPYAGDAEHSKSKPLAERIERRSLVLAGLWCVLPLLLLGVAGGWISLLLALVASALAWYAMRQLLQRRLQGFTGDGLGATQQVCEVAFYLGVGFGLGR
ncbi:adenosylcobinamide-GDP ribazoletransferase [Caenimonas sedimenti]|uniref:Adenosylcobinamide-GDP ribazoletransferase n=1 Tax=Caenimonas sedimenti TaxID=2596921 RepID=A0A562ZJ94_9BURK|nr:adenosylcobinamide-GDP ribazoletransferase [Caenimonas sedimenti]TWO68264.1 adenosylcobinamide-GDP ribazoletransferase [Caenimonas sedimenti]